MNSINEKRIDFIEKASGSIKLSVLAFSALIFLRMSSNEIQGDFKYGSPLFWGVTSIVFVFLYLLNLVIYEEKIYKRYRNYIGGKRPLELTIMFLDDMATLVVIVVLTTYTGGAVSVYRVFVFLYIAVVCVSRNKMQALVVNGITLLYIMHSSYKEYRYVESVIMEITPGVLACVAMMVLLIGYVKFEKENMVRVQNAANMDYLTSINNRRAFNRYFYKTFNECALKSEKISIALLDIDYFKSINDIYGHYFGDETLKIVAKIIRDIAGENNFVARYGGEEFVVVMPGIDEDRAVDIAEEIRKAVEGYNFNSENSNEQIKITISIGICTYPDKATNTVEMIKRVDDALYKAKFLNRNRVEIYDSVLEEIREDMLDGNPEFTKKIKTLMTMINEKDNGYICGHCERMVIYADLLSSELNMTLREKKLLRYAVYIHDIGKIHISDEILNKKSLLTKDEWEEMKRHPEKSVDIIKDIKEFSIITPAILHHHERYDGDGYPSGLNGENIPYFARIISVLDSFDAMTNNRPYNDQRRLDIVIEELKSCSGKQFDPIITDKFISVITKNKKLFYGLTRNTINVRDIEG